MELINVEQGSQEWHDLRAKYYKTASRTPVVLGLSPFSKIEDLAKELKHGIKPYYNNAMRRGNELEPMVRELANKHFNDVFEPAVGVNADFLASLDGINFDGDTIIEIKVSEHTYHELKNGKIPEYYKAQMLHQMFVFEAKKSYLVAYSELNNDIAVSDAVLDDAVWFWDMLNAWHQFDDFMESYELPAQQEMTDKKWKSICSKLIKINEKKKKLEAEEKQYKEQLIELSKGVKSIGCGVMVYPINKNNIDYKKLIEDKKIDVEPYKTSSTSWGVKIQ